MLSQSVRIAALGVLALIVAGVGVALAGGDVEDKLVTGDTVTVPEGDVVAATSLPEIGGIVKLCVIVLGLGAMTVAATEAWQRRHPPAAPSWGAQVAAPTPPTTG